MMHKVMVWILIGGLMGQMIPGTVVYADGPEAVVAVLHFGNTTGDAALDPLGESLAEGLVTDLAHRGGVRLVERRRLKEVMEEIRLGGTGLLAEDQAVQIGEQVGATVVVLGSFRVQGDRLEVNARVVEVSSGEVVHGEQVEGKVEEQGKAVRRLGGRLWSYWTGNALPGEGKSWYARWWVWLGVALIGGGAYAFLQGEEGGLDPLPDFPGPPE